MSDGFLDMSASVGAVEGAGVPGCCDCDWPKPPNNGVCEVPFTAGCVDCDCPKFANGFEGAGVPLA